MNKIERKFNFKTLMTFLMVLTLTLAMVFATACGNNSESSSESTSASEESSESESTRVDEQTLKNGDFYFHTAKSETSPNSPSNWTYSADGDDFKVSTSSSVVTKGIIDTAKYDKLDKKHKPVDPANEDGFLNPGTPLTEDNADTEADESDTKVLMINNIEHSAQFYTSQSTISVPAGQHAKISVWVNTIGLENYPGSTAGAYIKVKNNVVKEDSNTYDPLVIKDINTNGVWTEYVIYLTPNQSKATSYTLVLGLGEGDKVHVANHVKGFAYFDNAIFTELSADEFDAVADKGVTVDKDSPVVTGVTVVNHSLVEGVATPLALGGSGEYNKGATQTNTVAGYFDNITVNEEEVTDAVVMDFTKLTSIGSAYTFTSDAFTLDGESYVRISFWAKIDALEPQVKATMSIWDTAKDEAVASFDNVSTVDYENELTNDYARYTFYVANNYPSDNFEYNLKLTFGPSLDATDVDEFTLPTGFAIFKDFEIETLDKDNYDLADVSTDTRAKKAVLTGEYLNDYTPSEDEEDSDTVDTYSVNVSSVSAHKLENGQLVPTYEITSSNLNTHVEGEANVGVVNSKYDSSFGLINEAIDAVDLIDNKDSSLQVLAFHNVSGKDNFVFANQVTIPENSVYKFSVRVYAHANASAFVRLVNMDETNSNTKVIMAHNGYKMETKVSNADSVLLKSGFAEVTFIIATGNESFNVRLEFGVDTENGVALFDSIVTGTTASIVSADDLNTYFPEEIYDFENIEKTYNVYYYANIADVENEDLRLKDDKGNVRFDKGETNVVVAFGRLIDHDNTSTNSNKLIQYYRLNTDENDVYVIEAPETETPDSSEEVEETPSSYEGDNLIWLQISSIIIAIALIGALVAVIIRKAFAGRVSKKKKTEKYYRHHGYNKDSRYTKASDVAVPDDEDTAGDYDYEEDSSDKE